ncbi:MAG: tetratricopeptide repeat protein, partial [Sandarakinorhabdus sp.]|nr:tetratricopeptide repeat protein [Sandarakinorhabdus sp.]
MTGFTAITAKGHRAANVGAMMGTTVARLAMCWALGEAVPALAAPDIAVRPVVPSGMPDPQAAPEDAYRAGKAALARGDARAALAHFRSALRRDPAYVAALSGAGVALDQLGRHDLARPYFEAALAAQPDAPDLMYNLGLSLSMSGYTDRARALLVRAAARGNDDVKERSTTLLASLDGAMAPNHAVQRADNQALPVVQSAAPVAPAVAGTSDVAVAAAVSTDVAPGAVAASQAPPADAVAAVAGAAPSGSAPPAPVAIALERGSEPVMLATAAPLAEPLAATVPMGVASITTRDPAQPVILASAPPAAQLIRTDAGEWRLDVPVEPDLPSDVAVATVALPPQPVIPDMPPLAPVAATA